MHTIMSVLPNPVAVVDNENRVTYVSKSMMSFTRVKTPENCIDRPIVDLFDNEDLKAMIDETVHRFGFFEDIQRVLIDGKTIYCRVISDDMTASEYRFFKSSPTGFIRMGRFIHITDVTPIMMLSLTDPLTNLPNKRCLNERMQSEWRRALRDKTYLALLMIDVDLFKNYNDIYGHQQGDILLKDLAKILDRSVKRPADFVARFGGEEFCILLPNTGPDGAYEIAERVRQNVQESTTPLADSSGLTSVTISIGIACLIPGENDFVEDFIGKADTNLYAAKYAGRNRVVMDE
jgi:diguanylate cyclase (GGDEF)-like protein